MKNILIIILVLLQQACTSITVGVGYPLLDPKYKYTNILNEDKSISLWKQDFIGIIRADSELYSDKNSQILLEYEHISSIGSDYSTLDSVNILYKFNNNK